MLMGEFERSIDAKGRLIIPAKFREQLGASFVLTRGMDGCLLVIQSRNGTNCRQNWPHYP